MLASAPLFPKFMSDRAAMHHELRKRGTSAPLFPKFVSNRAAMYHELRKRGTGATPTPDVCGPVRQGLLDLAPAGSAQMNAMPPRPNQRVSRLAPLEEVYAFIDAVARPVGPREVAVSQAAGRALA